MPIARQVKLIDKYKFTKVTLDGNSKIFVVYISALDVESSIYSSQTAQIIVLE